MTWSWFLGSDTTRRCISSPVLVIKQPFEWTKSSAWFFSLLKVHSFLFLASRLFSILRLLRCQNICHSVLFLPGFQKWLHVSGYLHFALIKRTHPFFLAGRNWLRSKIFCVCVSAAVSLFQSNLWAPLLHQSGTIFDGFLLFPASNMTTWSAERKLSWKRAAHRVCPEMT